MIRPDDGRVKSTPHDTITFFGRTNFRDSSGHRPKVFGLRQTDRLSHVYLLGKTGVGKSTAMATLLFQDLASGRGVGVLDPHGDLIERVLAFIPDARKDDVIYFNVPDADQPLAFNPLEKVLPEKKPLAASGLLEALKKIWDESWGPRTEHILRNAILALLDQPEATLADVLKMLDDSDFRAQVLARVENAQVRRFWLREYKNYTFGIRAMAILPIQNKIGAFLSNPLLHRILVQPRSTFDVRRIMDEGKILLVNLAKGRIGEDTSALLGALLVTKIALAGHGRAEMPEHERRLSVGKR